MVFYESRMEDIRGKQEWKVGIVRKGDISMTRFSGTKYETELKKILGQSHVVLNLSPSEPGDLIIPELKEIREVKSVKGKVFKLSHPKERQQLMKLLELCKSIDYDLYYDVRFLGNGMSGWRSFHITELFTSLTIKGDIRHKRISDK